MTSVVALNMMAMSAALPLAMGRRVSGAARHAQHFFLIQAGAWIFILIASRLPQGLLSRELLYTAVTRAHERVRIYGSAEALAEAITTPVRRASGLAQATAGDAVRTDAIASAT